MHILNKKVNEVNKQGLSKVTCFNDLHLSNELFPREVTEEGIITFLSELHS